MFTSEKHTLSQDCLKEIKLQINQRLFETGLIANDVYSLAQDLVVIEE